jgi:hypothetical protein
MLLKISYQMEDINFINSSQNIINLENVCKIKLIKTLNFRVFYKIKHNKNNSMATK